MYTAFLCPIILDLNAGVPRTPYRRFPNETEHVLILDPRANGNMFDMEAP